MSVDIDLEAKPRWCVWTLVGPRGCRWSKEPIEHSSRGEARREAARIRAEEKVPLVAVFPSDIDPNEADDGSEPAVQMILTKKVS